jgi:hypothetical protein
MGFGLCGVCHFFGSVDNGQCDSGLCGWGPWRPGGLEAWRPGGLGGLEALVAWGPGGLEVWRPRGLEA